MDNENVSENKKTKKTYKALERVTIEDRLKDKLNSLTAAANESLQGIAEVSKSDVVNLILNLHDDQLSKFETEELRKTHFDVFKCLTWLQNQAKDAKDKGAQVSLKELFEKSSEFMTETTSSQSVKTRKPRKNKLNEVGPSEEVVSLEGKSNRSE
ncbi:MAG: hypothetical protein L6Q37_00705 [Bdellovibrionaceae bacterium]|nr:hypothetical protein [Pseudobdellovibrionaceae bacterium]